MKKETLRSREISEAIYLEYIQLIRDIRELRQTLETKQKRLDQIELRLRK